MNTTDATRETDEAVAPVTGRLLGVVSNAHTLLGARPVREADLPGWMWAAGYVGMGNAEGGTGSRGDAEGAEGVGGGQFTKIEKRVHPRVSRGVDGAVLRVVPSGLRLSLETASGGAPEAIRWNGVWFTPVPEGEVLVCECIWEAFGN